MKEHRASAARISAERGPGESVPESTCEETAGDVRPAHDQRFESARQLRTEEEVRSNVIVAEKRARLGSLSVFDGKAAQESLGIRGTRNRPRFTGILNSCSSFPLFTRREM